MGKLLAIDFGLKRTGLAITDENKIIASGLKTVDSRDLMTFLVNLNQKIVFASFKIDKPLESIVVRFIKLKISNREKNKSLFMKKVRKLKPEDSCINT